MVRCKCIQVRSVSACGSYWSSIEALFHKAERCRQIFVGQSAVTQYRVKNVFELRTTRSQTPPWWGALGVFNFHSFRFFKSASLRTCWFQLLMLYMGSFSLATKFVPLSDQTTDGVPRRAQNLQIPISAPRVHARDHLEVDSTRREAGKKKAPSFLRRSFDRYKEWSKIINVCVRKRGFFESESFAK